MRDLFGTDGIRGRVGESPLTAADFLHIGQAVGEALSRREKRPSLLVGRDTRESGAMLQSAVVAGLLESGVSVIDAGVITTPGVAFLTRKMGLSAGAVISASHNPMSENGIKFFGPMGRKFSEDVENEIEALLDDGGQSGAHGGSKRSRLIDGSGLKELYIRDLLEEHPGLDLSPISIVLDCANGAASYLAPEVFARAGARILSFHASPTGANINVLCGSEHLRRFPQDMRAQIERYQARFGLAFDGDADRVIIFDAAGNLIDGDYMLGILGKYFAGRQQLMARSVVTTTMRNMGLKLFLDELGLQMHETPVGDKYVIEKLEALRELDNDPEALGLGGEQSGHIIIMDKEHLTGDGIRSALFVIQALSDFDLRSVDELVPALVKMPQLIASAYVGSGPRLSRQELEAWTKRLLVDVPGMLRVNLRYSGTEPLFRIMLEVDDHYNANELAEIALEIARKGQSYAGLEDAPVDILHCG